MDHDLYAIVKVFDEYGRFEVQRVFVATYESKLLAQWWAINIERFYVDFPNNTKMLAVASGSVLQFEIEPTP